jgi:hypothetical protein
MKSNWAKITEDMAMHYGCNSPKGQALVTLSQLCKKADAGVVEYIDGKIGIRGAIPSCIENGADFTQESMRGRLGGLASAHPEQCRALTTHDLNSFEIKSIGALVTEIRMS